MSLVFEYGHEIQLDSKAKIYGVEIQKDVYELAKKSVEVAAMVSENPEIVKHYGEKVPTSPRVKRKRRSIKNKSVINIMSPNN